MSLADATADATGHRLGVRWQTETSDGRVPRNAKRKALTRV
jgi:hypothetical protein